MANLIQQLKCAQRELAKRQSVYPRLIRENKLSEDKAALEIDGMASIIKTLQTQVWLEEVSADLGGKRVEVDEVNIKGQHK